MSPRPPADSPARPYEVAIVGNDAVLAALPSRPMQLAHALLACGFDLVVPVSWGEELVAEHVLRAVAERGSAPAIFCACPLLRARLLSAGSELAPHLVTVVSPAVAAARYLRASHPGVPMRITLIGGCPGVRDASIDSRIAPLACLRMLSDRGISLVRQPAVFESVIPPDRRRFLSLPGGCPAPKALETRAPERRLVTITDDAFATELADHLLGRENVLIDLSTRLACACCGGFGGRGHRGPMGREEILRHEPPRAHSPIVDHDVALPLDVSRAELMSMPTRRGDDDIDHDTEQEEDARLPGARTIDVLRQRLERQRIAVTPATAVPPVAPRRSTRPPRSTTTWSSIGNPPLTPTSRPDWSTRAVESGDPRSTTPPDPGVGTRGYTATPEVSAADVAQPVRSDVVVPLTPQREGMPHQAEPTPSTVPPAVSSPDVAPREVPLSERDRGAAPVVAAFGDVAPPDEGSGASEGGDLAGGSDVAKAHGNVAVASTQVGEPSRARFRLSRSQLHPRARSGGQVLPRAYIRHSAPAAQREAAGEAAGEAASAVAPKRIDVELHLDLTIRAPEAASPATEPPEPHGVAGVVAGEKTGTAAPEVAERGAAALSTPEAPPSRDIRTANVQADALARLRQQKQPPARVVSRAPTSPRAPRDLGSLAVIVATVVLGVAIIVFLAVTFRWAPTAPWQ